MTLRLYVHKPAVVVSGQIDDSFDPLTDYPVAELPIKSVSGLTQNMRAGMTVIFGSTPGADDLGRQRVRVDHAASASLLDIGYSSRGRRDGEVDVAANSYFTVLDDRRVWAKVQRFARQAFEPYITLLKDWDLPFAAMGEGVEFFPKANSGPPRAGVVDPSTGVLTVELPGPKGVPSYSVPVGVGIATYLWDVGDGTITVGTTTSASITATFPPGFRYISLTVTDDNGRTHKMHTPVLAEDPSNPLCVPKWKFASPLTSTQQGASVDVQILSPLPRSLYLDGTPVLIFDDAQPDHLCEFVGWHHNDTASLEFVKTGYLRDTVLHCLDLVGKLDKLPAQPQVVENQTTYKIAVTLPAAESATMVFTSPLPVAVPSGAVMLVNGATPITITGPANKGAVGINVAALSVAISTSDKLHYTAPPQNWMQMRNPSIYKMIDYLLRWHSTALEIADWSWPTLEYDLAFVTRASDAGSLYAQVAEQARCVEVDHIVGCNQVGQLLMRVDPNLQAPFHRTSTVAAALSGHIAAIRVVHERPPRYQWIRGGGVIEGWTPITTTVPVEYTVRPAAESFADVGATVIGTYPLPVAIGSGAVLYLRGLGGVLLPWATTSASASQGATSVAVEPLADTVSEWDELVYKTTAPGPDKIPTVFCIAPGPVYGQGLQTLTVGNKLVQNQAGLNGTIGNLYERVNAEYTQIEIDLVGVGELGVIDPTEMTWVTMAAMDSRHVPQRALPLFVNGARLLPIELSRTFEETRGGMVEKWTLRAERETVGSSAVTIGGDE